MVNCLERGADLHMAQLMPLPLTVSCFRKKSTSVLPFWYRLTRVVPEKGPLKECSPMGVAYCYRCTAVCVSTPEEFHAYRQLHPAHGYRSYPTTHTAISLTLHAT